MIRLFERDSQNDIYLRALGIPNKQKLFLLSQTETRFLRTGYHFPVFSKELFAKEWNGKDNLKRNKVNLYRDIKQ